MDENRTARNSPNHTGKLALPLLGEEMGFSASGTGKSIWQNEVGLQPYTIYKKGNCERQSLHKTFRRKHRREALWLEGKDHTPQQRLKAQTIIKDWYAQWHSVKGSGSSRHCKEEGKGSHQLEENVTRNWWGTCMQTIILKILQTKKRRRKIR